jgi:hypothetical protein
VVSVDVRSVLEDPVSTKKPIHARKDLTCSRTLPSAMCPRKPCCM